MGLGKRTNKQGKAREQIGKLIGRNGEGYNERGNRKGDEDFVFCLRSVHRIGLVVQELGFSFAFVSLLLKGFGSWLNIQDASGPIVLETKWLVDQSDLENQDRGMVQNSWQMHRNARIGRTWNWDLTNRQNSGEGYDMAKHGGINTETFQTVLRATKTINATTTLTIAKRCHSLPSVKGALKV